MFISAPVIYSHRTHKYKINGKIFSFLRAENKFCSFCCVHNNSSFILLFVLSSASDSDEDSRQFFFSNYSAKPIKCIHIFCAVTLLHLCRAFRLAAVHMSISFNRQSMMRMHNLRIDSCNENGIEIKTDLYIYVFVGNCVTLFMRFVLHSYNFNDPSMDAVFTSCLLLSTMWIRIFAIANRLN